MIGDGLVNKKIISIITIVLAVVVALLLVHSLFKPDNAQEVFQSDYDDLVQVVEYLSSLENESHAYIGSTDGTMTVRFGEKTTIDNEDVINTVSSLFDKGYYEIVKSYGTIYFERWKDPFGCFKGFAFSMDGTGELNIEFLTEKGVLSEENWYFYVSDYNEWRNLQ